MENKPSNEILSGNIFRVIFIIVAPILGSNFLETAWHFLNGFWIGKLGPVSFAAINVSSFFVWMFYALLAIVNTGTNSLVAQMEGAGDHVRSREIAHQGILGNIALSTLYSIFMIFFGRSVFVLMGAEPSVVNEACRYIVPLFIFGVPFGIMESITSILRGYGDTRTPLVVLSLGFLLTFALDPLLILGLGPFPRLGVAGGAIASAAAFSFSTIIYFILIIRKSLKFSFSPKLLKLNPGLFLRIVQIGLPSSLSSIVFSIVYIILTTIIARFGTEAMAAVGIGHRIESLSFMLCLGFSLATITIVGQNVGAGNLKRAEQAAWINVGIISVITLLSSACFYEFSDSLARIFASDPKTLAIAVHYLKIISFCQVFMGIGIVLDGGFSGAGDTVPPMIASVSSALLRVPLAYLLAITFCMGTDGIWWAITILCAVRGTTTGLLFLSGRWKRTRFVELLK